MIVHANEPTMRRVGLLALGALALGVLPAAAPDGRGRQTREAAVRFDGGGGRPGTPRWSGDAGVHVAAVAVPSGGLAFRLAESDRIILHLDGPATFTGKSLVMKARGVTISESRRDEFLVIQSIRRVRHHHELLQVEPSRLTVGANAWVMALVDYDDDTPGALLKLPRTGSTTFLMARSGTVTLMPLLFDDDAVAWGDHVVPTAADHAQYESWRTRLAERGLSDIEPLGLQVERGDLDRLQVKLVVTRDTPSR